MNKMILNVERNEIFALLADNEHVYCFNYENESVVDLYYQEVNFIHARMCNAQVVFFRILEV